MNPPKLIHIISADGDYYLNIDEVEFVRIVGNIVYLHYRNHALKFQLDPSSLNTLRVQLGYRASGGALIAQTTPSPFTERGQGGEVND